MQAQKITHLIFDADYTLLDYLFDEVAAFERLYRELNIPISKELLLFSRQSSEETWTKSGMYDVHKPSVQKNYHQVYREHLYKVFFDVFQKYPCPNPQTTPQSASERFLTLLEWEGKLLPGVEEVLSSLSEKSGGKYKIYVATNGLTAIQKGRLRPLQAYLYGIFVSEEIGSIKPLPAFFERMIKDMGTSFENCLMIGDSLFSDVAGAKSVGMKSCWLNVEGVENNTPFTPEFTISSLKELFELL